MCLIAFRWQPEAARPLVLAANRDEFHARPTRPLGWWRWPGGPLAGRDLSGGGTWMAADRSGRFAAVTNFRDPAAADGARSRGELPLDWLQSSVPAGEFAASIHARRGDYSPFSLVFGDAESLWVVGTHSDPAPISAGLHALSNHVLDTPWPKSIRAVRRLDACGESGEDWMNALLDLLDDREPAPADALPDTGVGRELESMLSAPFIVSERYGTRSSTALVLGDSIAMAERTFDPAGVVRGERRFTWSPEEST